LLETIRSVMNLQKLKQFTSTNQCENISDSSTNHAGIHTGRTLLSFEDICPRWSHALATGFSNNKCLDMKDGKRCIVGEAHGFRDSAYICTKCWEYSQSFVASVYGNEHSGFIITNQELFERLKENFLQHFNQRHAYRKGTIATIRDYAERLIPKHQIDLQV
jgi:hypothetical protein